MADGSFFILSLVFFAALFIEKGVSQGPYSDSSNLVYASTQESTVNTRILCNVVLECTGTTGTQWLFSGSSSVVFSENNRFINMSSYSADDGTEVVVASLSLIPALAADNGKLYDCVTDTVNTFSVSVNKNPLEIGDIPDIDLSGHVKGSTILIPVFIGTCLSDIYLSVYKGGDLVFTEYVNNDNYGKSVTVNVPLEADVASVGEYGTRVVAENHSTPLKLFNVLGSPMD